MKLVKILGLACAWFEVTFLHVVFCVKNWRYFSMLRDLVLGKCNFGIWEIWKRILSERTLSPTTFQHIYVRQMLWCIIRICLWKKCLLKCFVFEQKKNGRQTVP